LGWWKNFVKAFGLQGRKVYITGESYAGMFLRVVFPSVSDIAVVGYYIPYISDAMLTAADKQFFNLEGVLLVTPIIGDRDSQQQGG
jgi:carboxypeptidase D